MVEIENKKFRQTYNYICIFHSLLDWRRWFSRKGDDDGDDDAESHGKDTAVSIWEIVSACK